MKEKIYEKLASIEHERWCDWQKYMHSKGEISPDGCFLIYSLAQIKNWERQIATPYAELSEQEKQSDRDQVDRYWPLIDRYVREVIKEILPEDGNLTMNEINNGYVLLSEIKQRADEL